MNIKTGMTLLMLGGIMAAGSAYAQGPESLTESQKTQLQELRESGDRELIKTQLQEWGITKSKNKAKNKGSDRHMILDSLDENQKQIIKDLHESDSDKERIREKLQEFGIDVPQRSQRKKITDEQKQQIQKLKKSGDTDALQEYFNEIGVKNHRIKSAQKTEFNQSLTISQQEALANARELAKSGDKEKAQEIINNIFQSDIHLEKPTKGITGFFKKIFTS